ncbi:MAG: hypothetical protein ACFE95_22480 [Candidatus Hodarchaeota archaeon]
MDSSLNTSFLTSLGFLSQKGGTKIIIKTFHRLLIIIFLCTTLLVQVNSLKGNTNLQYNINVGDEIRYQVTKLSHDSVTGSTSLQSNMKNSSVWIWTGNDWISIHYTEQLGSIYSIAVTGVTDNGVTAKIFIDDQRISQYEINITKFNTFTSFIMPITTNYTYYEQLSQDSKLSKFSGYHYELSGYLLNETRWILGAGSPFSTVGIRITSIFDIRSGWLESCSYHAPDYGIADSDGFYIWYSYEISRIEGEIDGFLPSINIEQFIILSLLAVGISIFVIMIYEKFKRIGRI